MDISAPISIDSTSEAAPKKSLMQTQSAHQVLLTETYLSASSAEQENRNDSIRAQVMLQVVDALAGRCSWTYCLMAGSLTQ